MTLSTKGIVFDLLVFLVLCIRNRLDQFTKARPNKIQKNESLRNTFYSFKNQNKDIKMYTINVIENDNIVSKQYSILDRGLKRALIFTTPILVSSKKL